MNAADFQTGQLVVIGDGRENRGVWVLDMDRTVGQIGRVVDARGAFEGRYTRVRVGGTSWLYEPRTLTPLSAGPVSDDAWSRLEDQS